MKMKKFLSVFLSAMALMLVAGVGGASAALVDIDINNTTLCAAHPSTPDNWNDAQDHYIIITKDTGYDIRIHGDAQTVGTNKDIKRRIFVNGAGATQKFTITLDNLTMTSTPCAIQIFNGAEVDLKIVGTTTIITPDYAASGINYGSNAMIHIGSTDSNNGQNCGYNHNSAAPNTVTRDRSIVRIFGDSRESSHLVLDMSATKNYTANGADGIRACASTQSITATYITNNKLWFEDLDVRIEGIPASNRGICGDTTEELFFDTCNIYVDGGNCISGGLAWGAGAGKTWCDIHFRNCSLNLTGSNPSYAAIAVHGGYVANNNVGYQQENGKDVYRRVIFCDSEDNTAIITGNQHGQAAVQAPIVEIAGGAVEIRHTGNTTSTPTSPSIITKEIDIRRTDTKGHPIDGKPTNIILYADMIATLGDSTQTTSDVPKVNIEPGVQAFVSAQNNWTDTGKYVNSAEFNTNRPGHKVGNVVGDFELFDIDSPVLTDDADYTIHDNETIVVQLPRNPGDPYNTLSIREGAELVIEKGGQLIIETIDSVNNGTVIVEGLTDAELREEIKKWGFTGTGTIVNKDTGMMFDNTGTPWDEIVANSPADLKNELKPNDTNLVVIGKNDKGESALVAVNPTTSDDSYTLPLNQNLDLMTVVLGSSTSKLDNAKDDTPVRMAVWPLNSDGTYPDPASRGVDPTVDPDVLKGRSDVPLITPVRKINNGKVSFTLEHDDIRKLREHAKDTGVNEFVIWVYDVDPDGKYQGTIVHEPFVFRIDLPEHQLEEAVQKDPSIRQQIKAGPNLIVFDEDQNDATVVAINPDRSAHAYLVPQNTDLALNLYIAQQDGEVALAKSGRYEGQNVKALIRLFNDAIPMTSYLADPSGTLDEHGPFPITNGYVDFNFAYSELRRLAIRHRQATFVAYIYDTDTNGSLISREFIFRLDEEVPEIGASHCSGCAAGAAPLALLALAAAALIKRRV